MTNEAARHAVLALRSLSETAYVLRMERKGLDFEPGQYIHVGPLPGIDRREYSVYSAPADDFLEILVKEVPQGVVSPGLRRLSEGEYVDVEGPFGFFRIEEGDLAAPFLFIATGTGISPFHCHTRSRPQLDYTLIHGVRSAAELYDHHAYDADRLVNCISRPDNDADAPPQGARNFRGRVTDWLRKNPAPEHCMAYLCGSCDMIYEVYDILGAQGLSSDRIHAEVYF